MDCIVDYFTYKDVIIIRDFKKGATVECILKTYEYIFDNNLLTPNIKGIISDYRNCDITFSLKDLEQLEGFHKNNPSILMSVKLAYVIDTPDIVYGIIFSMKQKYNTSKSFSTLDAAKHWILSEY